MAGIDVGGGGGGRRATNSDLNMVPFIDLLMVTIAFLLITAVWVTSSRLAASTQVPARDGCGDECPPPTKALHVHVRDEGFSLVWKQGATVLDEMTLPRPSAASTDGGGPVRYPELARAIATQWARSGEHRDPADPKSDEVVVHTDDRLPFRQMVGVLDAIDAVRRDVRLPGGRTGTVPAFRTVLAER